MDELFQTFLAEVEAETKDFRASAVVISGLQAEISSEIGRDTCKNDQEMTKNDQKCSRNDENGRSRSVSAAFGAFDIPLGCFS